MDAYAMAEFKSKKTHHIYMPEDIMIDILSRLPVKSLMRFGCVCKSWRSLIHTSTTFISQHLNRSILDSKGGNLLVTSQLNDGESEMLMDVFVDGAFNAPVDSRKIVPSLALTEYMDIISNNGLLCINTDGYHSYVICNPATRQFREIPKRGGFCNSKRNFLRSVLFGVVTETNDYKLITIVRRYNFDESKDSILDEMRKMRVKQIEVYTKSTGLWREIDATALTTNEIPYVIFDDCSCTQVKGNLYWVSSRILESSASSAYLIMGFDIRKEKFFKLAMPDFEGNGINEFGICNLTEIEGSLALVACNRGHDFYHVWTMNDEHGDQPQAWVKKFRIKPFTKSCDPIKVWGWKNYLVVWKTDCGLLSVQMLDGEVGSVVQEMKNLLISCDDFNFSLNFHKYVESLIHV